MQLVKLVYFSHAWMLVRYDRPLFVDSIEAWRYGPMVSVLYQRYKQYGASPITEEAVNQSQFFDEDQLQAMSDVAAAFKNWTGIQLSSYTHQPGTPWFQCWSHGNRLIPNDLIKSYYGRWLRSE